jgi:flavin-dependent dehydrogenase
MYDVIVVGGRCAGSATGMLLARAGYRVLIVDRVSLPADIACTHQLTVASAARLERWGLLDGLLATGCPVSDSMAVTAGASTVDIVNPVLDGLNISLAPRRALLDSLLLEAARDAGAEVWDAFGVRDVVWRDDRVAGVVGYGPDGHAVCEDARVVVGADGRSSVVSRAVDAETYGRQPAVACCYYAYWRRTAFTKPAWWLAEGASVGVIPTDDDLTCVVVRLPVSRWAQFKREPEATYLAQVVRFPALVERLADASRQSRFVGTADLGQLSRRPWGPGWALVGDAGRHADPAGWAGIGDAFRQADLLAAALDDGLSGRLSLNEALCRYHRHRDAGRPWPRRRPACAAIAGWRPSPSGVSYPAFAHGVGDHVAAVAQGQPLGQGMDHVLYRALRVGELGGDLRCRMPFGDEAQHRLLPGRQLRRSSDGSN